MASSRRAGPPRIPGSPRNEFERQREGLLRRTHWEGEHGRAPDPDWESQGRGADPLREALDRLGSIIRAPRPRRAK
jgi:hypothetical protein